MRHAGSQLSDQGSNLWPLHWKHRVLTVPVTTVLDSIPINHHRVLSRVPCAIQQVPISYLYYLFFKKLLILYWGIPGSSGVKNSLAKQGTRVQSLGFEDHLVGKGNSLQHPCLGNPMDRRAWQARLRGVTKSRTILNHHHSRS